MSLLDVPSVYETRSYSHRCRSKYILTVNPKKYIFILLYIGHANRCVLRLWDLGLETWRDLLNG